MAFKMNKSVFNFGEGTGSSPKKIIASLGNFFKNRKEQTQAEGSIVTDPQAQNAGDPNIEAKKAMKLNTGQTATADEKMDAINKIINS